MADPDFSLLGNFPHVPADTNTFINRGLNKYVLSHPLHPSPHLTPLPPGLVARHSSDAMNPRPRPS